MTVNGVGSYGTFAASGSSGRNVKSGQSVRFNFLAVGEKAEDLLAGMKEPDTGKRSSDRSILEDSGCFDSSYWSENMKKAAEMSDSGQSVTDLREEYARLLKEKSEEIFTKIKNGETENSYQIGSQSFTEKEWDEFLSKFDSVEDAIRKLMEEEQEKRAAEELEKEKESSMEKGPQTEGDLLTADSTSCTYPADQPDEEDIRYITWYTEEGIFCRKAGQTEGYEWSISFENREQYEKVMSLIGQFPSDWNLRFAAHENFWRDFLDDKIDVDDFMDFMRGTSQGVPDFSITEGDSVYIDTEKAKWAEYTNPFGAEFHTAEEMKRMDAKIIAENEAKLQKVTYGELYKRSHPEYQGEKIFCRYPGGTLYTADEIDALMFEQYLKENHMTLEDYHASQEAFRAKHGYPGYY